MFTNRLYIILLVVSMMLPGLAMPKVAIGQADAAKDVTIVTPTVSRPMRELPVVMPSAAIIEREVNPRRVVPRTEGATPIEPEQWSIDPLLAANAEQIAVAPTDGFTTPLQHFEGQPYTAVMPPDPVGDVGADYFVQAINNMDSALISIYSKDSGARIGGPFLLTDLSAPGSICATGYGDPIVLYDEQAGRWLLSEMAAGDNGLCVYISKSSNPLGDYYAYAFPTAQFPDYPKYSVWLDAYYVTTNEDLPAVYALERSNMLSGATARMIRRTAPRLPNLGFQTLTPVDVDGTAPVAESPGYFIRQRDTETQGPANNPTQDFLEMFAFEVDWATPSKSSLDQIATIPIAEFSQDLCGLDSFSCFRQPDTLVGLDPLREVVMWRAQYRNFGTHETLVGNFVTDVDGKDHGGVRWFELRKSGASAWSLFQQGTVAPDMNNRWMGSIAMDAAGNIALGYNLVSPFVYPSLRVAGRLAGDPVGKMPLGEVDIADGWKSGETVRYGDYNSMNVDPVDGCTFWFTGEYNASAPWSTYIASLRFDNCGAPTFALVAPEPAKDLCLSETDHAVFPLTVRGLSGYGDQVSLKAVGSPGAVSFSQNPALPGATVAVTLSGVTPGNYEFDVVGTSTVDAAVMHTRTLTLAVKADSLVTVVNNADAGLGSLRQALADVCSGGTVRFAPGLAGKTIALSSGELVIDRDVNIIGSGESVTLLSGGTNHRVFRVLHGATAAIERLTIQNTDLITKGLSGAALMNEGAVRLFQVRMRNNRATSAGAMLNLGNATLVGSELIGNRSDTNAGAILHTRGQLTLQSTNVQSNVAATDGGGIRITAGAVTVTQSTVISNVAADGAAIATFAAQPSVMSQSGQAFLPSTAGALAAVGPLVVVNSVLAANRSTLGSTLVVMPVDLSGGLRMVNSTIAFNDAPGYSALMLVNSATAFITNTILAANGAKTECYKSASGTLVVAATLATDASCTGAIYFTPAALALSPLGDYGGGIQSIALLPDSRAINAALTAQCPPVDIRDVKRIQGAGCDAGAYESRGFMLAVQSGNNQSTPPGQAFPLPLVVSVTPYSATEPVDGGRVNFMGSVGGPTASYSSTVVISGSLASTPVTAHFTSGPFGVIALAEGSASSPQFRLTITELTERLSLPQLRR